MRAELAADVQHHDRRRRRPSVDEAADDHDDGDFGLLPEAAAVLTAEQLRSDAEGWFALCGFFRADSDGSGARPSASGTGTSSRYSDHVRGGGRSAAASSAAAAALC